VSTKRTPAGAVLLAAGRGSRLASLTEHTHKSLLPIGGRPSIQYLLDELIRSQVPDIVVVVGDKHDSLERFVAEHYSGRVTTVLNERYAEDTNILSTELGVSGLRAPEKGYLIVETDLVVAPGTWPEILDVGARAESFWVTRGRYSPDLTGGALRCDLEGNVTDLVYSPKFTPDHAGWQKLLGILYVGPEQVVSDRRLRQAAIAETIAQYYMMPWVHHLSELPCRSRDLGARYASSFNDLNTYRRIDQEFTALLAGPGEPP
jgi:CTP:molybdopterin cytidylyltransferase MocA